MLWKKMLGGLNQYSSYEKQNARKVGIRSEEAAGGIAAPGAGFTLGPPEF
jgi:hypothetical protein